MSARKVGAKWGFGMAPVSPIMRQRYDNAVQSVLDILHGNILMEQADLDAISELKGMFNRCIRQDQWDWFTVYSEFGTPNRAPMEDIAIALQEFRRSVTQKDAEKFNLLKARLVNNNILHFLDVYQTGIALHSNDPGSGWVYILSTREQRDILKIGMTTRSVAERVKEINAATGVCTPFAARAVFRVRNAARAERALFQQLAEYRVRADREFFHIDYFKAASIIKSYIKELKFPVFYTQSPIR